MKQEVSIVGIVGAGKMGLNLFYYLVDFNFKLVLVCKTLQQQENVINIFQKKINRELKNQLITKEDYHKKIGKVCITNTLDSLKNCDLIIEAVSENKDIKKQLFSKLLDTVNTDCLLVSNSSSIPAYELGLGFNIIGMHFFYPVAYKNIVELNVCKGTDIRIIEGAKQFLITIKRKCILLYREGAFMLNRLFLDFQNMAYQLKVNHNLSFSSIDAIVKKYFFPIGVFRFFDNVGLDVMLESVINYSEYSSKPQQYNALINELKGLTSKGFLGKKTKRGFYSYESQSMIQDEQGALDKETEQHIYQQLLECYLQSASYFVDKGVCDKDTIDYSVKEYMDIQKGPFEMDKL